MVKHQNAYKNRSLPILKATSNACKSALQHEPQFKELTISGHELESEFWNQNILFGFRLKDTLKY